MAVIAIIAALLLEQWHPLSDRKMWRAALATCAEWIENTFNAGEEHHGTIAIESSPSRGASVSVLLPLAKAA